MSAVTIETTCVRRKQDESIVLLAQCLWPA